MIDSQFDHLKVYLQTEKGLEADRVRLSTGAQLVSVRNVPIKAGWSLPRVDVLFLAPPGYPAARPDCFWVSPALRLANGAVPQNANDATPIPGDPSSGRALTWFSWHLQTWDPNRDSLATYYATVMRRLIPAR